MYAIYALIDPRDHSVHYVGMTDNVYKRFIAHLQGADGNFQKNAWVNNLKALNKMIIMKTLEEVQDQEQARGRESYWIKHFAALGQPLSNTQKNSLWEGKTKVAKAQRSELTSGVSDEARSVIRRAHAMGKSHHDMAHVVGLAGDKYHIYEQVCAEEGIKIEKEA